MLVAVRATGMGSQDGIDPMGWDGMRLRWDGMGLYGANGRGRPCRGYVFNLLPPLIGPNKEKRLCIST